MPKNKEDAAGLDAERMLGAAMLGHLPFEVWNEEACTPDADEDLPELPADVKSRVGQSNPFRQQIGNVDKLSRAADRDVEATDRKPKARKSIAASQMIRRFPTDPESRRRELVVMISSCISEMGVNPATYFADLARRMKIPVFESPDTLDLAMVTRVARVIYKDNRAAREA